MPPETDDTSFSVVKSLYTYRLYIHKQELTEYSVEYRWIISYA